MLVVGLLMGQLNEITLEKLHGFKEQIDEGKPREHVLATTERKQGDQLDATLKHHSTVINMARMLSFIAFRIRTEIKNRTMKYTTAPKVTNNITKTIL